MICHYCKHPIVKGQWQREAPGQRSGYVHLNVNDCPPTLSQSEYHAALVLAERERAAKIVTENFHLPLRALIALIEGE